MNISARSDRRREVALAGHLGDRATAESALEDSDEAIRELALGAMERLGALDDDRIGQMTDDPSIRVRRRLAELLAVHTAVDPTPLLTEPDTNYLDPTAYPLGDGTWRLVVATAPKDAPLDPDQMMLVTAVLRAGAQ